MPDVFPFRAVQYSIGRSDVSGVIAPPYDVLDAGAKARLIAKDHRNVVTIDLPHTPAKELGPAESYEAAGAKYRAWLKDGTLRARANPAMFAYRQSFPFSGEAMQRCGMACAIETAPLGARAGGGILPHEETFSGPKEDRLALMKATQAQISPIFGLFGDDSGRAKGVVRGVMGGRRPDLTAMSDDGVKHEVWAIEDQPTLRAYADALAGEDVFIADGHHRYSTGLNYLRMLESRGPVPPDHPARRCMIVLVGMSDPGLVIGPTHRVLGGMRDYTIERFIDAASEYFDVARGPTDQARIESAMRDAARSTPPDARVLGFLDVKSGRTFVGVLKVPDPLASRFPDRPQAWRALDVAIVQHLIVDRIAQPLLNAGDPVTWAFPHSVDEVLEIARGHETGAGGGKGFAQLAVIVRPTPLAAVKAIGRAGGLMPQKSTFFYPKLATGLFINPLG